MTKINMKFKRSAEKGAMGSIYYEVVHQGHRKSIKAGIVCLASEWDGQQKRLKRLRDVYPDTRRMQIESDMKMLRAVIERLERRVKGYTACEVRDEYLKRRQRSLVATFMRDEVERMEKGGRFGTARAYRKTMDSFGAYLGCCNMTFCGITPMLIDGYAAYLLRRGVRRNTLSFYMRVLRAASNRAVKLGLAEQALPFRNVYTGVDKTDKRAVDFDSIMKLNRLELEKGSELGLARDMFMFSFLTRGMTFVDMAWLKKEEVANGEIHYKRHKTGQMLQIRINDNIGAIIRRYDRPGSLYVFPVIGCEGGMRAFTDCQTGLSLYNRRLKKLAAMIGLDRPLTSYTARHSWATAAYRMGVPLQLISAGMGHTKEETTRIYLASLENWKIDNANDSIARMLTGRGRRR